MPRILMTGASGGIGTSLRKLLPPIYPDLLLSDLKAPADLGNNEKFKAADLADLAQVEAICEGVDSIIHFGGYSVEGPWNDILQANIIGCYNLFEAAHRKGVKRVVFASSNHAIGSAAVDPSGAVDCHPLGPVDARSASFEDGGPRDGAHCGVPDAYRSPSAGPW